MLKIKTSKHMSKYQQLQKRMHVTAEKYIVYKQSENIQGARKVQPNPVQPSPTQPSAAQPSPALPNHKANFAPLL